MADASQLQLSPYALFDPSQWANPYSSYQGSALPGASYVGTPYNAMGQPIQPQPGMTINSTPQQAAAQPAAAAGAGSGILPGNPAVAAGNQAAGLQALNSMIPAGGGKYLAGPGTPGGTGAGSIWNAQAGGAAQPAAAAANSAGLTPQQYMALRANPGPVGQYGATVPQSASSAQPGPGVLQSFLANWKPASSGAGSGFQQGFSSALKGMGYS